VIITARYIGMISVIFILSIVNANEPAYTAIMKIKNTTTTAVVIKRFLFFGSFENLASFKPSRLQRESCVKSLTDFHMLMLLPLPEFP
jgi:hypothetical protein